METADALGLEGDDGRRIVLLKLDARGGAADQALKEGARRLTGLGRPDLGNDVAAGNSRPVVMNENEFARLPPGRHRIALDPDCEDAFHTDKAGRAARPVNRAAKHVEMKGAFRAG